MPDVFLVFVDVDDVPERFGFVDKLFLVSWLHSMLSELL